MLKGIEDFFKELKQQWSHKKQNEIQGLAQKLAEEKAKQLASDLEELTKRIVKQVETSILNGVDLTASLDTKFEQFQIALKRASETANQYDCTKKLFAEFDDLKQECEGFEAKEQVPELSYDLLQIQRKLLDSIKLTTTETKKEGEEEKKDGERKTSSARSSTEGDKKKSAFEVNDIQVARIKSFTTQNLITKYGTYFVKTRHFVHHHTQVHPFFDFASFQLFDKLYLCGGLEPRVGFTGELNYKLETGEAFSCTAMHYPRGKLGLSGATDFLAAIGGVNDVDVLACYEKYLIEKNAWEKGQCMRVARERPGVCCYSDGTIYAFGGNASYENIESYAVERKSGQADWVGLDVIFEVPIFNIAAMPYKNNILIFGGYLKQSKEIFTLMGEFKVKEGKFLEYLDVPYIPYHLSGGSFITMGGEIFVATYLREALRISIFNGEYWRFFKR